MSERVIFETAISFTDQDQRLAYLERACAGNAVLRARIDALLVSHAVASDYLKLSNLHRRAAQSTQQYQPTSTDENPVPANHSEEEVARAFLEPTNRPDSLGRMGHYEMLQILGKGGFGIVFRAFDDVLHRIVAVKVLSPVIAATSPARKRFLREARASAAIRHENVVQVYEVCEQPLPYIVLEYIPGETLHQRLNRVGPVDVAEVLRMSKQLAEGLAAAHATDLIHRDVKPANVLIDSGHQKVKLTDFGLARTADDASLSHSGFVGGTPMYMAPEQASGEKLDHRADLFSLGSVMYQMVTGRPPFRADTTMAILKRVVEDTPRPIREIIPETPQWLCDIISKLHEKDPAKRFQSARELADVLAHCETQLQSNAKIQDVSGLRREAESTRRFGWMIGSATAVLLASLGIIAAMVLPKGSGSIPPVSSSESKFEQPEIAPKPRENTVGSSFTDDIERIASLLPEDQIAEVRRELQRQNPNFDALLQYTTEGRTIVAVNFDGTHVNDISPLRVMRSLRKLTIKNLPFTDLNQIVGLRLTELGLWSCKDVKDLTPLIGMPLEKLWIGEWAGSDLRPLQSLPLKVLKMTGVGQSLDLTFIQKHQLKELSIEFVKVADLMPLKAMPLEKLHCTRCNVKDITPLAGLPLRDLNLSRTQVLDLTPLTGLQLEELDVEYTLVSNLAPLKGMQLSKLFMKESKVTDLSPIKDLPLRVISCNFVPKRDTEILRGFRRLKTINELPKADFWNQVEAKK